MNVKEYRKRCEAGVKKAAKSYQGDAVANSQALLADSASDSKSRVAAIENAQIDGENIDSLAEQYLHTLRDPKESVAVRLAALDALKAADFLGPQFDPYRADYLQALRELASARSKTLRESALEMLAIHEDPYAQEVLLRGLKNTAAALISPAKAIQLLGYDDHGEVFATVRSLFQRASGDAKEESVAAPCFRSRVGGLILESAQGQVAAIDDQTAQCRRAAESQFRRLREGGAQDRNGRR